MKCLIRAFAISAAFGLILGFGRVAAAEADRIRLRHEALAFLAQEFLGNSEPVRLDDGGWHSVVLSPPATPLSPAISAFDPNGFDTTSVSQLYENMTLFDKTLSVRSGLAFTNERAVSDVWDDLLNRTLPADITAEERQQAEEVATVLFRARDEVDDVRGIVYLTEPSSEFRRYREFELLYRLIQRSRAQEDGAWRLHTRLGEFSSLEEAEESVVSDWITFGRKQVIETALSEYKQRVNLDRWAAWTRARKRFDANKVQLDADRWVARTFLYPPPSSWLSLSSWTHLRQQVAGGVSIEFDMARVKVIRPWMSLADLLDHKLRLNEGNPNNGGYELTDGVPPSFDRYPLGRLAVFVEELLLIRNVSWSNGGQIQEHPFGAFRYPDAINLAAYIVCIMPAGTLRAEVR